MTATLTPPKLMTAEELLAMPSNHMRHELIRGELHTMAPAGFDHGYAGMNLAGPLFLHVASKDLGAVLLAETGFILRRDPDTVRAPDIAFVKKERLPPEGSRKAFFSGPPDLAVEVVSLGDTVYEVEQKVLDWLEAGTGLVRMVNPKHRTITVHRSLTDISILRDQDWLDGESVVLGFRCQIKDIFA